MKQCIKCFCAMRVWISFVLFGSVNYVVEGQASNVFFFGPYKNVGTWAAYCAALCVRYVFVRAGACPKKIY